MSQSSFSRSAKRLLIGPPFPSSAAQHERLDKLRGLAIFASDPISSNAYATEAIMQVLVLMGSAALALTLPIAGAIALLVVLVVLSYRQTIFHYPHGGGAYSVASDNLGVNAGLIAAAALLTDYVLTVSVSISAGIRALTSAYPGLEPARVGLALLMLVLLTLVNLRGVRESGTIFAFPTYAFVGGVLFIVVLGILRLGGLLGGAPMTSVAGTVPAEFSPIGIAFVWLLLRAFASGCTALTGIEAISDGVAAFKPPEAKNAAITMLVMGIMAMSLFLGISFLATHLHIVPAEESVLSQMTRAVTSGLPGGRAAYLWVQAFTTLILVLAANTGYQDFPRLGFFLARDGFLPRWMQNRGDRLVFSSGIVVLTALSTGVVLFFRADELAMLPLYAIGVMISFTLSQAGMVRLWHRIEGLSPGESIDIGHTILHYESSTGWKKTLNAVGAAVTFVVLWVLFATKFRHGAWVLALTLPALVAMFRLIRRHYDGVKEQLSTRGVSSADLGEVADVVVVPIADVHRGTLRALKYAKRLATDVRAVVIVTEGAPQRERIQRRWDRFPEITDGIRLDMVDYEYRDIVDRLVDYIDEVNNVEFGGQLVTVVVPEFVPGSVAEQLLHNQTANLLRLRLRSQPDVVVIDVPYHI